MGCVLSAAATAAAGVLRNLPATAAPPPESASTVGCLPASADSQLPSADVRAGSSGSPAAAAALPVPAATRRGRSTGGATSAARRTCPATTCSAGPTFWTQACGSQQCGTVAEGGGQGGHSHGHEQLLQGARHRRQVLRHPPVGPQIQGRRRCRWTCIWRRGRTCLCQGGGQTHSSCCCTRSGWVRSVKFPPSNARICRASISLSQDDRAEEALAASFKAGHCSSASKRGDVDDQLGVAAFAHGGGASCQQSLHSRRRRHRQHEGRGHRCPPRCLSRRQPMGPETATAAKRLANTDSTIRQRPLRCKALRRLGGLQSQAAEAAKDAGRQDAVHEVIVPFIF
mmetsp:Transcript_46/g.155  ORF Transcript_46/g.155 Transcript_46/m.155 type:complete len:341 (-) Transcript_46:2473-3495(-)